MQLVLTKMYPEAGRDYVYSVGMGSLFKQWMAFNKIYIGNEHTPAIDGHFSIEYNCFHHLYEIILFPIPENRISTKHWDDVLSFIRDQGYKYTKTNTWKWIYPEDLSSKSVKVDGLRIVVDAI